MDIAETKEKKEQAVQKRRNRIKADLAGGSRAASIICEGRRNGFTYFLDKRFYDLVLIGHMGNHVRHVIFRRSHKSRTKYYCQVSWFHLTIQGKEV